MFTVYSVTVQKATLPTDINPHFRILLIERGAYIQMHSDSS